MKKVKMLLASMMICTVLVGTINLIGVNALENTDTAGTITIQENPNPKGW